MSRVFLAEEPRLGRRVVVKVLPAEMSLGIPADRFEREIRLAASLQHPHLVPVLNAGAAGDVVYYVMPYIEGDSLAARIGRDGALPLDDVIRILRDVLDALAYAHARGVVHRDIKPDNILLSGRHALVTDFGVAKAVTAAVEGAGGTTLTSTGMALGTPAYMAPEQAAADPRVDARADLYALGVVAYEMLAGRPPFTAPTPQAMLAAQVAMTPEAVDRYRPGIPADLSALVMRALAKIPGDRPQSAEEMLGRLDAVRPMTPVSGVQVAPTVPAPAAIPASSPAAMRTPRIALLFALATAVLTIAAYAVSRLAGLPDWVWVAVLACMLLGLPIVLYTNRVERRRAQLRATGEHSISGEHTHQRWFTWRRALSGGAAALGTVVLLSSAYVVSRKLGIGPAATLLSAGTLGAEDRLVLADFVNRTADSSLGPAVTEALRVDLGQSRAVQLLDGRQVTAALQRMGVRADTTLDESLARTLAIREGAKAIVAGDISRLGSGYVLTARIVTADSGATLAPVRVTADDDAHLIGAVNHLSADLRERIGESLRTIRSTEPLEQVTTASLPALRLYTAGTRAFDAGRLDVARQLLERATQTDTAFAMAWRKLAAVYFNIGAGVPAQFAAATRAFNHRDRLPPLERALTEGFYYTAADPERAIAAYRAALENSPGDNTAVNNLGLVLNRIGRTAVAESVLRAAMTVRPSMTLADNLIDALAAQSKWAAIDTVFQQADRASPPSHPGRVIIRLTAAFARRDYVRAESLVAANEVRKGGALPIPVVFYSRLWLDIYHGRFARAARLAREVSESTLARGDRRDAADAAIIPATLLAARGRTEEAASELKSVLAGPAYRGLPETEVPVRSLAQVSAALGDVAGVRRARQIFETTQPPMSRSAGDSVEWVAMEAQAEHRWPAAAAAFSREAAARFCSPCGALSAGRMWEVAGLPDSAIVYYRLATDRPELYSNEDASLYPLALRRLGDLYEQRGDRAAAIEWYSRFVDLWHDADPDLQPVVREVRDRIARLTAEPRSP